MRSLSKSKLMAFRQCPKRLWLEIYRPELRQDSSATQASFAVGNRVGHLARQLYDPKNKGILIEPTAQNFAQAFAHTQTLLQSKQPIFEAGFQAQGALAFADVLLPVKQSGKHAWRMIEVKSSASLKDYHHDDAAIQAFIARASGLPLAAMALAHVNSKWVYPGDQDYSGLLIEHDLTEETLARENEVRHWIASAQEIAAKKREPRITTGSHCSKPYACGFLAHCQSQENQESPEQPIAWLPKRSKKLQTQIAQNGWTELRQLPDALLNDEQQRVKSVTLSGKTYFNRRAAAADLAAHALPAYFLDFESISFTVPIWKGTRAYQQIPFQFSLHKLTRTGRLEQQGFLDLSGADPSRAVALALIDACGQRGPIFAYNADFEKSRISELAQRFPRLGPALLALNARIIDLLPLAQKHYYHPSQHGSWSLKALLPAICPDLHYSDLDGVQNGGMAMEAFLEAISPNATAERKAPINQQLQAYCALDTYALVRLWALFSGSKIKIKASPPSAPI